MSVVLITGAAAGLGEGIARAFAAQGAKLVLGDINAKPLEALAAELGADCVTMVGDVSDPRYAKALVELAVDRFGGLDIAVNNAGIVHDPAFISDIPEADARRVIEVDLLGVLWALQAQIPAMKNGSIINIASVAGLSGAPTLGVYAAAKHGVVGLTRTAALENARRGIRVNAVCPSFARTAMAGEARHSKAHEAEMTRGIPMRRLASVAEVVRAVMFLADPANSFMTGQTLGVDGGMGAM
ncbi:MAG: SDR family oxidoreductase [Rhodobacteraceae bacterium]|nr:SDR family oxidoreductase [Paracoccaceae bacterium]